MVWVLALFAVLFSPFQVAYLGPSRRLLEGCDKKWGLRAGEDITIGTFVCTIAGQARLQCEKPGTCWLAQGESPTYIFHEDMHTPYHARS